MKQSFAKTLKAKYRGFLVLTTLASLWMAIPLAQFVWFLLGRGNFHLRDEWGAVVLMAFPVIAIVAFVHQYRRHRAAHANFELSIQASLRALLDENRFARTRAKVIALLNLAVLLVLPVVISQLRSAGKAGDEILVPGFVVLPAILAIVLVGIRWNYVRTLKPRQKELETLLAAYNG